MRRQLPIFPMPPLEDGLARRISYLRLSVTDRCNFRCTYCMPAEGFDAVARSALLDFAEIERLVAAFVKMGVRRLRLTGGEPTVRKGIVELTGALARIAGLEEVVMTTNALLLGRLAKPLQEAGLKQVNVSLDTLDPERFFALTRKPELPRVLQGIDAALHAGLEVKLNTVALRSTTAQELVSICRYAWERDIVPRFIEHMPMSSGTNYSREAHLSAAKIRDALAEEFGELQEESGTLHHGPSRYWRCRGGRFGIISAMSEHFCDSCNRLRLSCTGELHTCLGYDDATDLRALLRRGAGEEALQQAIRAAVLGKRAGHQFDLSGGGGPSKHMISIGG